MDPELLVEPQIDDGHRLLIELVREGMDVTVAAWVWKHDAKSWHLYIGSTATGIGNPGDAYGTVYECIKRLPGFWIGLAEITLIRASDPIARDLVAIRDRRSGGRVPVRCGSATVGEMDIDEAYIYPRITAGLTRDEVIHTVTALLNQTAAAHPSTVTLRDGTVIRGVPFGLELNRGPGPSAVLQVKIADDVDGSTRIVPADDVANIQ